MHYIPQIYRDIIAMRCGLISYNELRSKYSCKELIKAGGKMDEVFAKTLGLDNGRTDKNEN